MKLKVMILLMVLSLSSRNYAQDPVFSQFYNAHLQMNAAMAGNTNTPMIGLNYRNQWPELGNIYTSYSVNYDQFISSLNSGLGIGILTDNAGDGTLKTTGITGYYSYRVKVKNDVFMKGGMELGWTNTSLDWDKLQFGDALSPVTGPISPGGTPYPSSEIPSGDLSHNYLKVGAGVMLYSPLYYVGFSLKNINTPDYTYLGSGYVGSSDASIPVRLSLHAGGQIILKPGNNNREATFISPNVMFQRQGDFNMVNLGAYLAIDKIHFGLWYRHTFYNGDALIPSFGVKKDFLKITYSFDLTLSQLGLNQGGSHELGIGVNFDYLRPQRQNYNDCFQIFR